MSKQASATLRAQRETVWRHRLARFAASKQTVEAFCRREAVPVGTFYGWQSRLRARDVDTARLPQATPAPFIDLGPVNGTVAGAAMPDRDPARHHAHASTTDDGPTAINIRLDLGFGVVLHIARH